jgi:hypothetical protein
MLAAKSHVPSRCLYCSGSCYAFAAVAALESAYNVRHNYDADRRVGGPNMQTFSEQQVVDCDRNGDSGCVGGAMENVYGWAAGLGYLCTQDSYRYVSGESQRHEACAQAACDKVRAAAPLSYSEVQPRSDQALMAAIAAVPVSVGIDANADDFQFVRKQLLYLTSEAQTGLVHCCGTHTSLSACVVASCGSRPTAVQVRGVCGQVRHGG